MTPLQSEATATALAARHQHIGAPLGRAKGKRRSHEDANLFGIAMRSSAG